MFNKIANLEQFLLMSVLLLQIFCKRKRLFINSLRCYE